MPFIDFFKNPFATPEAKVRAVFSDLPELSTQRLRLVKITPGYAQDMYEYSCDADVTKYLTWSPHSSVKETERYIKLLQKRYQSGAFNDWGLVLKENGKFIGTCGYTSFDFEKNRAELGYVLSRDYWGMGLAVEACLEVMRFGCETFGFENYFAKCMQGNDASMRVMQKLGMKLEGIYNNSMFIKGEYKTIIVYSTTSDKK